MRAEFERDPLLGALGGLVRDTDEAGNVLAATGLGSFDWFLRAGQDGPSPAGGFPAFFFPEGGCMLRRSAFLACGGFFEPYFLTVSELDARHQTSRRRVRRPLPADCRLRPHEGTRRSSAGRVARYG